MKRSLLFLAAAVCFAIGTNAQVINVPADKTTIQAAIDSATSGDTVLVSESTYYENINFKGKDITVASQFILDGDTSHIRKTVIDGSQVTNPDSTSTVTMRSGEDTTSVLMGFTITGGKGTNYYRSDRDRIERGGGGVFILGSGGKIINNIIEGNNVEKTGGPAQLRGGGIFAWVYNNHSVVIRKNIIRNNKAKGENAGGGGIAAYGGRIICEYNEITNNTAYAQVWVYGGGMLGMFFDAEGVIKEAVIRNNLISGNLANTNSGGAGGGGYYQGFGYDEEHIKVYNNIICNNHSTYIAGGVFFWNNTVGRVFNNTIVDNTAVNDGKNVYVAEVEDLALYNNIIWSYGNSIIPEFGLYETDAAKFKIFNNIIMEPFKPGDGVTAFRNMFNEPIFQPDSFNLAENSPGVGWAFDTVQIDTTWYYAPSFDFYGNPRPHPIDGRVDLGAVESSFPGPADNADLAFIGLWDRKLWPDFHEDTLHYVLPVPDTTIVTPQLDIISDDWYARVDIDHADSLGSPDPADRTTTITVTAYDGTTQKIYTVLFKYASTNATLDTLSTICMLNPPFDPEIFVYEVCLPTGVTDATPGVYYKTAAQYASVEVVPAPNIFFSNPLPNYKAQRTTKIIVTPEEGNAKTYEIEFKVEAVFGSCEDPCWPEGIGISKSTKMDISLYPVPFNTFLTIDMMNSKPIRKVEILSLDGRIVRITDHIDTPSLTINRENLPSGLYFLRIHADEIYVKKIIVR